MTLSDKRIIVTGSTTGIGEAIARRCHGEGAQVLIHGRDEERGRAIAEELGKGASFHADDLLDPDAANRLRAAALDTMGGIDGLVNNVGWPVRGRLEETDAAFFDKVIGVNLRAPILLTRVCLPDLKASKGVVLNIGSINAHCGEANLLAYSVAKGGLMTFSRNLADTLGPDKVRVTHFNVGWVLSGNEHKLQVELGQPEDWHRNVPTAFAPSGHVMVPHNIAAAAVFWLSDESRPISGTVLELEQFPVIGRNPVKADD